LVVIVLIGFAPEDGMTHHSFGVPCGSSACKTYTATMTLAQSSF